MQNHLRVYAWQRVCNTSDSSSLACIFASSTNFPAFSAATIRHTQNANSPLLSFSLPQDIQKQQTVAQKRTGQFSKGKKENSVVPRLLHFLEEFRVETFAGNLQQRFDSATKVERDNVLRLFDVPLHACDLA